MRGTRNEEWETRKKKKNGVTLLHMEFHRSSFVTQSHFPRDCDAGVLFNCRHDGHDGHDGYGTSCTRAILPWQQIA